MHHHRIGGRAAHGSVELHQRRAVQERLAARAGAGTTTIPSTRRERSASIALRSRSGSSSAFVKEHAAALAFDHIGQAAGDGGEERVLDVADDQADGLSGSRHKRPATPLGVYPSSAALACTRILAWSLA